MNISHSRFILNLKFSGEIVTIYFICLVIVFQLHDYKAQLISLDLRWLFVKNTSTQKQ